MPGSSDPELEVAYHALQSLHSTVVPEEHELIAEDADLAEAVAVLLETMRAQLYDPQT